MYFTSVTKYEWIANYEESKKNIQIGITAPFRYTLTGEAHACAHTNKHFNAANRIKWKLQAIKFKTENETNEKWAAINCCRHISFYFASDFFVDAFETFANNNNNNRSWLKSQRDFGRKLVWFIFHNYFVMQICILFDSNFCNPKPFWSNWKQSMSPEHCISSLKRKLYMCLRTEP